MTLAALRSPENWLRSMLSAFPPPSSACSQAFLAAIEKGRLGHAELLLEYGADPLAVNKDGNGALFLSVESLSARCCRLALSHGCDPLENIPPPSYDSGNLGVTPLSLAAEIGKLEIVELLLSFINFESLTIAQRSEFLCSAIRSENKSVIALAWPPGSDPSLVFCDNLFLSAVSCGSKEIIAKILGQGLPRFEIDLPSQSPHILGKNNLDLSALMMAFWDFEQIKDPSALLPLVDALLPLSSPDRVDAFGRDALMVALDCSLGD